VCYDCGNHLQLRFTEAAVRLVDVLVGNFPVDLCPVGSCLIDVNLVGNRQLGVVLTPAFSIFSCGVHNSDMVFLEKIYR